MRGRAGREPRLDPVRWRRPGRATLLRSAVVAVLIVTAAVVMWARPGACDPGRAACDACAGSTPESGASALGPQVHPELPSFATVSAVRAAEVQDPVLAHEPAPDPAAAAECRVAEVAGTATARGPAGLPPPAAVLPGGSAGPPGAIAVPPGSIGVPIRLAEPTALRLIHPGDHVDVFRLSSTGASPQAIATAALVLEVTGADDPTSGGLLLALTPADARRAVTTPSGGYAVLLRPDG